MTSLDLDMPIINTHSHHLPEWERPVTLQEHLARSYTGWRDVSFDTPEARAEAFFKLRAHSPFVWLSRGLQMAWNMPKPLSCDTWEVYEKTALKLHEDDTFEHNLLLQCGYKRILLDAYSNPGYDNTNALFAPVFRVNSFLYGYNSVVKDHNGNNPFHMYSLEIETLEDYVETMARIVRQKKQSGCVALKAALPYDRGLDLDVATIEQARAVFGKRDATPEEEKIFGDYIFDELCRIACEEGLPVQIHTGMGMLYKSNPMQLVGLITRHRQTQFVLFHGGFPWTDEIPGLMYNHENVYADLCWLPLLSPSAAVQFLRVALEVGLSDKITWGCDTWTAEESLGAVMAGKMVIDKALMGMVKDEYMDIELAQSVASGILYGNAAALYNL